MRNRIFDRSYLLSVLMIVLVTAYLGELKIIVFSSSFRFGLGSAAFFFFLLFYRDIFYPAIGLLTGVFVTFFRIGLDSMFVQPFSFQDSFMTHSPVIGYYLVFSIVLYIGRPRHFLDSPFYLGVLGAFGDGIANIVELFIRTDFSGNFLLTTSNLEYVVIIAIVRSFFVVGLFNMTYTKQMKAINLEQRRRLEQVQMITSGLYVEVFYLKKLLSEIEDVTAKSYELYRTLKKHRDISQDIASTALSVAQEVHEVKKDNQRVLAGLEKIIHQETVFFEMQLSDLVELIIHANQKYSEMLNKKIEFYFDVSVNLEITKVYPLVVILNNLVANSVEAIEDTGFIKVSVTKSEEELAIEVIDNGIGIHPQDEDVIFEPGFTTKFDESGKSSTGIGLSHVRSLVNKLGGVIHVLSQSSRTVFKIIFPVSSLIGKE